MMGVFCDMLNVGSTATTPDCRNGQNKADIAEKSPPCHSFCCSEPYSIRCPLFFKQIIPFWETQYILTDLLLHAHCTAVELLCVPTFYCKFSSKEMAGKRMSSRIDSVPKRAFINVVTISP